MTYENRCTFCHLKFDWLAARFESPNPPCPDCGASTERLISAPAVIWSKPLVAYQDVKGETTKKDMANGGHFVFERDSDEAKEKGHPVRRFISTPQDQAEYCRREGLMNPKDLPSNLSIAKDGMNYETVNRSEV